MRTLFILDTSVLLYDPSAYQNFPANSDVILPIPVLDELDKIKTYSNEVGRNARVFIRTLDELSNKGNLHEGIKLTKDTYIKVDTAAYPDDFGKAGYADNKILSCAYATKNNSKNKKNRVVLVSRDINLRIRAKAFNIEAQNYELDRLAGIDEIYKGYSTIQSTELGSLLNSKGFLEINSSPLLKNLYPNEGLILQTDEGDGLALGRRKGDKVIPIKSYKPWGLSSRSAEQALAIDFIMDPKIPLVNLIGASGSGKTLLSVACALDMVLEQKKYSKISIFRPPVSAGFDIGFLPGTLQEKLSLWYTPIEDAFEVLFGSNKKGENKWRAMIELYKEKDILNFGSISHIRGRTINGYVILDELQQADVLLGKTLLTRFSNNSKVICTGDPEQIDVKGLDATNNALSVINEKFKESPLAATVVFSKCERSDLAGEAIRLL